MSVDIAVLLDIREAIERALAFTARMDYQQFLADERTMWAVYSQVLVIGEATGRISRDFQQRNRQIPWEQMIGMRNRLIHGYDQIKWDRVWDTVQTDIPKLKILIEPLIPDEPKT